MPEVPGSKQELSQCDEHSTFLFTASARQKVKQQASYQGHTGQGNYLENNLLGIYLKALWIKRNTNSRLSQES